MNRRLTLLGVSGALVLALAGGSVAALALNGPASPGSQARVAATTTRVSPTVAKDLAFLREEERVARDLYAALSDEYDGARPFSMITLSEQRHYDMVGVLLDRYGVKDPSAGRGPGSYADPMLQQLYDSLLARGKQSLVDAYGVAVAVETRDIADLERTIAETKRADIKTVLDRLRTASQQHLRAYSAAADGDLALGPGMGMGRAGRGGFGWRADRDCPMMND